MLMAKERRRDASEDLDMATATEWRPGEFALRDAWFPVVHSPTLRNGHVLRRLVHAQPFYIWRDGDRVRATEFHPATQAKAERSEFVDATGDYPVYERFGHIWVWYGDPSHADPALLPDIPFLPRDRAQPKYSWGLNFFHCTYELVLENILDLTHIDFVHGNFSGRPESDEDSIAYESTSETVTMIRTIKGRKTSDYQREVLGVTEKYQNMKAYTHVFIRSGVCFLHSYYSSAPSIPLMQSNTPESTTLTRANFVFGIQQTDDLNFRRAWPGTAPQVAAQDERVLNPLNPRYLHQGFRPDCSTRFDAAALHYRRRHNALVQRQKCGDYGYLPDIAEGSDLAEILEVKRLS
jgi:phenylpropionate dioxygenase-like ring-hydroxylating dioxygenase large terminal subunit